MCKVFVTVIVAYLTLGCDAEDDIGSPLAECLNKIATFFHIDVKDEITKHNYEENNNLIGMNCVQHAIKLLKFSNDYIISKSPAVVYYLEIGSKLDSQTIKKPQEFCKEDNPYIQLYTPDLFNEFVCLEQILKKFGTSPELYPANTFFNQFKSFTEKALGNSLYTLSVNDFKDGDYGAAYMTYIGLEGIGQGNLEEPLEFCKRSLLNATAPLTLGNRSIPRQRSLARQTSTRPVTIGYNIIYD